MNIHVASITGPAGTELHVSRTEEGLDMNIAQYCRNRWRTSQGAKTGEAPEDDRECILEYFDDHDEDDMTRGVCQVDETTDPTMTILFNDMEGFNREFVVGVTRLTPTNVERIREEALRRFGEEFEDTSGLKDELEELFEMLVKFQWRTHYRMTDTLVGYRIAGEPVMDFPVASVDPPFTPPHWKDRPGHPVADWITEVQNEETRQSYQEWCDAREEAAKANHTALCWECGGEYVPDEDCESLHCVGLREARSDVDFSQFAESLLKQDIADQEKRRKDME